jgi:hypothetical protein
MDRRSFLGSILAAVAGALAAFRPKPPSLEGMKMRLVKEPGELYMTGEVYRDMERWRDIV